MTGNVWEWTSTPFEGFQGFEPFPYPEYSQNRSTAITDPQGRLVGHQSAVLRTSFRNFFRRPFRIAFAGLRLAADA